MENVQLRSRQHHSDFLQLVTKTWLTLTCLLKATPGTLNGRSWNYVWARCYIANPSGRAVQRVGLRPLACWDCEFESRRGHGYMLWLLRCQVEVSVTGLSLVQRVLPNVVCPSVIEEPQRGCLGALQQSSHGEKKKILYPRKIRYFCSRHFFL